MNRIVQLVLVIVFGLSNFVFAQESGFQIGVNAGLSHNLAYSSVFSGSEKGVMKDGLGGMVQMLITPPAKKSKLKVDLLFGIYINNYEYHVPQYVTKWNGVSSEQVVYENEIYKVKDLEIFLGFQYKHSLQVNGLFWKAMLSFVRDVETNIESEFVISEDQTKFPLMTRNTCTRIMQ